MCGRATYKLTWEEIVRLYRLTLDQPAQNTRARYNVCPTTSNHCQVRKIKKSARPFNRSRGLVLDDFIMGFVIGDCYSSA